MTERGRTEQDGKRNTESWDKNKIEFGDKCNFPITSVLFITNLKPSCTPGESSAYPQHRGEERKNEREWRAGKERKEEEKIRFWERQLLTWPGTGLGGVALQHGWDGAHRLCRSRAHLLPNPCPTQHLPLPLTPDTGAPGVLPVTCSSQHCHLLLFLIFFFYARSWKVKKETEKQFSLLSLPLNNQKKNIIVHICTDLY